MQEVRKRNLDLLTEAMRGLERGYNDLDFKVMSQALDNIKDIDTILAMSDGRTAINALRTNDTDIEGTEIDDNIALMNNHFRKYIEAKKEYRKDNNEIDKRNSIRELEAFLNAMYGILEEMKTSSDFQEEREMVRDKLREMFSVYQ
nr:MAG TPA: hypothetical protein [Caudoviricetes sp.]DAP70023.1 MAG TPA: hypothetical protein [Caudoviricetes sp.]